ncbi:MAG: lysozyme inhibitor LprI family protein [Eubacteriales bacterium]|nr:lysozyme inhibitor LprI family protein [Eubacteriales bacterium]
MRGIMKPRGIWIAIVLILLVGTGTTSYIRQYTSRRQETTAVSETASGAFDAGIQSDVPAPAAAPAPARGAEVLQESAGSQDSEVSQETAASQDAAAPAMARAAANDAFAAAGPEQEEETGEELPMEAEKPLLSASPSPDTAALGAVPEGDGQTETAASYALRAAPVEKTRSSRLLDRLEELDAEIQKSRSQNQDTTTNALKAAADGERKVWEAELDRFVAALDKRLPGEELREFRKEQSDWTRQRESTALSAMEGSAGSALQELEYNRSLAETTRDRVYELANQYEDILSEAE